MLDSQNYFCIYCTKEKPREQFNSEHVILKALGVFGPKTMTLINKTCIACNQDFGDTIDNALSRETLEGVHRFKNGVKTSKKFEYGRHAKNQERTATSGFLKGHKLELVANENGIGLNYELKENYDVAFKKEDGSYDFYYVGQLPDGETLKQKYPNCLEEIKIINSKKIEDIEDIAETLSQIFGTRYELNEENHEGNCEVEAIYTKEAFRAIAKIAFNYIAYSNDTSLILQECFNPIRNFITKGIGEWNQFIQIEKEPIVPNNNGMEAHFITIHSIGQKIFSSVSLHNKIHYEICLAKNYKGKPIEVGYGHCFDPHEKKIHKLGISSIIPIKMIPTIQVTRPYLFVPPKLMR